MRGFAHMVRSVDEPETHTTPSTRMIARQRDDRILAVLRSDGSVSAQQLAGMLHVSPSTIRRDLGRLADEGRLHRVHGGAYVQSVDTPDGERAFADVALDRADDKEAVATAAVELVHDGDVVYLDIGTTTMRVARRLRERDVLVVTSSLAVLDQLRTGSAEVLLLGGSLRRNFESFVGPLTTDALRAVRPDVTFLSCTGVRPDGAVLDDISAEAAIKRGAAEFAQALVLLATDAKFPGIGTFKVTDLTEVDTVITTAASDPATLDRCRDAGGEVITV